MRGYREKEASKPSCRTKTKRKRHEYVWLNVVEIRVTKTKAKTNKQKGIVGKEMMLGKMESNREKPQMLSYSTWNLRSRS